MNSTLRTEKRRAIGLQFLAPLVLTMAVLSPQASATSVAMFASCGPVAAPNTGTTNSSTTIGVAATNTVTGQCDAFAFTDLASIKLGSSTPTSLYGGSASVDLYIGFTLINPGVSGVVSFSMFLPVEYDITVDATNTSGFSGAGLNMTTDYFNSWGFDPSNDPLANNRCTSPLSTVPRCDGRYQGTFNIPVAQANYNGGSVFVLHVGGGSQNQAQMDALHTITFGPMVLPEGVTFAYDSGVTGNPLNFQLASNASVPEPATFSLFGAALLAFVALRRKR